MIAFFRRWMANRKQDAPIGGDRKPVGVTSELDVYPAAPSEKVGLEVKKGGGAHFMSSDAAPALDQGISPTWTGAHDFKGSVSVPTLPASDSSDHAASTAFVHATVGSTGSSSHAGDPTAKVGLTVKKGAAETFMRSDAAPALDTSISPNWSEWHDFRKRITVPTMSASDNSTNAASTAFVHNAVQGASGISWPDGTFTLVYSRENPYAELYSRTYRAGQFVQIPRTGDLATVNGANYTVYKVSAIVNSGTSNTGCYVFLR